jgi:desulfoferrodoxin (superoxide reductase-like protein)
MLGVFAVLMLVALKHFPTSVSAHSPSGIELNYDSETNTLSVDVTHSVSDTNTHYIEEIEIFLNDVLEEEKTYTSQESTSSMSDTFIIEATDGDVIKVKAYCNQFGSYEQSLVIGDGIPPEETTTTTPEATTTTTDGNGSPPPNLNDLLFPLIVGIPIALIIVYVLLKKRQS